MSSLAGSDRSILVVDDQDLVVGTDRSSLRRDDRFLVVVESRVVDEPFGHAEHLLQPGAGRRRDTARDLREQFRPANLDDVERRQFRSTLHRRIEPDERQRRYHGGDRHTLALNERKCDIGSR
ncbi:MAG: hypothetical protein QM736_11885 [Vicinamibacterales bacterium]